MYCLAVELIAKNLQEILKYSSSSNRNMYTGYFTLITSASGAKAGPLPHMSGQNRQVYTALLQMSSTSDRSLAVFGLDIKLVQYLLYS